MTHRGTAPVISRLPQLTGDAATAQYVRQLVGDIQAAIDILDSIRHRSFTDISILDISSTGANLRVGDVFEDGGILKIVRSGDVFVGSLSGAMALGTVTVLTP